jgi:glycosyltransferase involved in cell wall biosynthesis
MQVSIIIPVYNAEQFVERAIKSALDQAETAEVICIDDGSTDNSKAICQAMQKLDKRVTVLENYKGIKGAGAARNCGLEIAKSEYIAFLDADDYYVDNRFEGEEEIFSKNSLVDGIAGKTKVEINGAIDIPNLNITHGAVYGPKNPFEAITIDNSNSDNNFSVFAVTLRKSCIEKIGNFDTSLLQAQDSHFIFRLIAQCKIIASSKQDAYVVYNRHDHNTTNQWESGLIYRRLSIKKLIKFSIQKKLGLSIIKNLLFQHIEYDSFTIFLMESINVKT